MASDRPAGDWRHQGGGKRPPQPGGTSRRAWQPGGDDPRKPARAGRSRGLRVMLAGLVTLVLVGLTVLVIRYFWPARYPELVIAGGNPGETLALPENAAGSHTAAELAGWATGSERPKHSATAPVSADADGVKIVIDSKPDNLVVYLTADGGADPDGAYLWVAPPYSASAAQAHKVRVSAILDKIAQERRDKKTLLVFDATRVTTSWPHGMVFNDFARALKQLEPEIRAIPKLAVICASDTDERSWLFEERRTTVFGYYFLEALRGDGHGAGARITAASAFEHVKTHVERWAVANRGEKQTPILLPGDDGPRRAGLIDLAAAPAGGYNSPDPVHPPAGIPQDLVRAWQAADELRTRAYPPEAFDPAKWREYLELLLRWERLVRIGADTSAVRAHVGRLELELKGSAAVGGLTCLPAAIPTAPALGHPTPKSADDARRAINELLGNPSRDPRAALAAASKALKPIFELPDPPPVEAHFVRMLDRHLVAGGPPREVPSPDLLKRAVRLRLTAERAAWRFGARDGDYPYAEYVFPWVRTHVGSADEQRAWGQDLLFAPDPKGWETAAGHFASAEKLYDRAEQDGGKVVLALATRDAVFARLPYYARWLANHRGNRRDDELDPLLLHAEQAALGAHELTRLTLSAGGSVEPIDKLRGQVADHLKAVTDAFEGDVSKLKAGGDNPSDWHALDAALTVPFIPANDREQLLTRLRHISHQLVSKWQQSPAGEGRVAQPETQRTAARHRRMALAILGMPSPDGAAGFPDWRVYYRAEGDRIGQRFRGLDGEASTHANQARNITVPGEAGRHLAEGAFRTRLTDPAAPVRTGFDLVALDQAFRRHELLLWQAERVTSEGWAGVRPSTPDKWYCREVAGTLLESSRVVIEGVAKQLHGSHQPTEPELQPWLAEYARENTRRPLVLSLSAERSRVVADEPHWEFKFSVTAKAPAGAGFPVSWVEPPAARFAVPDPAQVNQRLHPEFKKDTAASRTVTFVAPGRPTDEPTPGTMVTKVLYRGHVYEETTTLHRIGTPTREWVYNPPPAGKDEPAAFAVNADEEATAGTVLILIDLTGSMNRPKGKSRLEVAKLAVEAVLKKLPRGTWVTLAYFYGTGADPEGRSVPVVEPFGKPEQLNGANWDRLLAPFKAVTADQIEKDGLSTPLAGAIHNVLAEGNRQKFWPKQFTGSRTLIVVSDGEDNWGTYLKDGKRYACVYKDADGQPIEPGKLALDTLLATKDDVQLHLAFFGLSRTKQAGEANTEEDRARVQFLALETDPRFRTKDRTPARLWFEQNADGLVRVCQTAMQPWFPFRLRESKDDRQKLPPTLPDIGGIVPSHPLTPGVYDLWGAHDEVRSQRLELRPGARVMVGARGKGGKFELFLPPWGMEVARMHPRIPRTLPDKATDLYGLIPEIVIDNGVQAGAAGLRMVACIEPLSQKQASDTLKVERPVMDFAWFDVDYADGKPPGPTGRPGLRVQNKWGLWAPAWDLSVSRWEPLGIDKDTARAPVVTGYWLDGFPGQSATLRIRPNKPTESFAALQKSFRWGDSNVELLGIGREKYVPENSNFTGLKAGETYLTIRMQFAEPGDPAAADKRVFLHPNWKGTNQPYELYQHHAYYDNHGRYTARFGPVTDADKDEEVVFHLYSVSDLKKSSRSVQVGYKPGTALPDRVPIPDALTKGPTPKAP